MLKVINEKLTRIEKDSSKAHYKVNEEVLMTEHAVLKHYSNAGYDGIWAENGYWSYVLSLLFWDVIFAKVRGAVSISRGGITQELDPAYDNNYDAMFSTYIKLNGMPSDMYTNRFATNREDLIKMRYRQLQNNDIATELANQYKTHQKENCRLIENWDKYTLDELIAPLKVFSKETFLRILLRLISDISTNRSGFPDLIVYKGDEIRFVEVKSEKDKLSANQKSWITFLALDIREYVDIFLINHTDKKVKTVENNFRILLSPILITLGSSSSKKRDEMVKYFESQPNFKTLENNPQASFDIYNKEIKEIIKTVGRWKTTKFSINGKDYSVEQIRNAIYEYSEKQYFELENYNLWHYDAFRYGCNKIHMSFLNNLGWEGYGYIDTTSDEWVFDLEKVRSHVEKELLDHELCPYLDSQKVKKEFLKLPERINPKNDKGWAFIDNSRNIWLYNKNKWITRFSSTDFPGIASVVGINRLSIQERQRIIEENKRYSDNGSSYEINVNIPVQKSSGSGCFGVMAFFFFIGLIGILI